MKRTNTVQSHPISCATGGLGVLQQQHALFGELRVALAGVHLAAELAFTERDAALDALRPVVARFPGHLDVPDLKAARVLVGA